MAPKHKPRTATKAVGKCKATAGEKIVIAGLHASKFHWVNVKELRERTLQFEIHRAAAKAIDRAIARAVKKERFRCMAIIANARDATPYTAVPKATISRVLCSIEEGEQP